MTLIEELREETTGLCHSNAYHPLAQYDNGYLDGLERAIEIAEHHSDWIPASEPPKENGKYYIQTDSDNNYIAYYTVRYEDWSVDGRTVGKCVIAWQPLPKPYEGERK